MNRRLALAATTVVVAALAGAPAHAGGGKVTKGSYKVSLVPDPTAEATGEVTDGCSAILPTAVDNHAFTVPGAGTLDVVLDAPDPAGSAQTDWDLYLLDADGSINTGSSGTSAHEEAVSKYKGRQKITIQVCNLAGAPNGTISWTFTAKK
ncbi:MAG: hypothetical protein JWP11_2729 [Frankiales bacterium]|nr:hypothetical protein [Frankiales bacterium]